MITIRSGASTKMAKVKAHGGHILLLGMALMSTLLLSTTTAEAQPVRFRYVGGRWSHDRHVGWNRYWGGPSIGFYYAPTPVYLVPGYAEPSYYRGSSFWYSNPSFGLSINLGGGGGGYYGGSGYYGGRPYGRVSHDDRYYHGGDHSYHSNEHAYRNNEHTDHGGDRADRGRSRR